MATNAFGITTDDFNLDAWLDQGSRPRRTVKVYRDWRLMDELAAIEAKIAAEPTLDDQRLDGTMADDRGEELREEYTGILERLASSALEVTLQAITSAEAQAVAAAVPHREVFYTDKDGEKKPHQQPDAIAIGDALVAASSVAPKLTPENVRKMRETLGDGPTLVLFETCTDLRTIGKVLPTVPFSRGSSDASQE